MKIPDPTHAYHHEDILAKAIVGALNAMDATVKVARTGVDELCPGCGMYRRHFYQTDCDRCAQYLLVRDFLEKNHDNKSQILSKYKQHQRDRMLDHKKQQSVRKEQKNQPSPAKGKKYRLRSDKARMKTLKEEKEMDSSSSHDNYEDAQMSNGEASLSDSSSQK